MKTLFDDLTSPWHRPQLIEKGVQAMVKKKVKTTIVRRCKKKEKHRSLHCSLLRLGTSSPPP